MKLVREANQVVLNFTETKGDRKKEQLAIRKFKDFEKAHPGLMEMMNDLVTVAANPVGMNILTDREQAVVRAMAEAGLVKLTS